MMKKETTNNKSPNLNRLVGMLGATTLLLTVSASHPKNCWNEFSQPHLTNSVSNRLHHMIYSSLHINRQNHPSPNDKKSLFYSVSIPVMSLQKYIQRFVFYSKAAPLHFVHAIVLIGRIGMSEPCLKACTHNIHRLFTVAIAIAIEMTIVKESLDMEHIRKVGGISTVMEFKRLIQAFKHYIKQDLTVSQNELELEFSRLAPLRFHNSDDETISFISASTASQITTDKEQSTMSPAGNSPVEIDISNNQLRPAVEITLAPKLSHETGTLEAVQRLQVNNFPLNFNPPKDDRKDARDAWARVKKPIQKQKSKCGFKKEENNRKRYELSKLLSTDTSNSPSCIERSISAKPREEILHSTCRS